MDTTFPSKNFLKDAYKAFDKRENLQISVHSRWRKKILEKEVGRWLPCTPLELLRTGLWQTPSAWCGFLMAKLNMIYYMALSCDYEVNGEVHDDAIIIMCTPLY